MHWQKPGDIAGIRKTLLTRSRLALPSKFQSILALRTRVTFGFGTVEDSNEDINDIVRHDIKGGQGATEMRPFHDKRAKHYAKSCQRTLGHQGNCR